MFLSLRGEGTQTKQANRTVFTGSVQLTSACKSEFTSHRHPETTQRLHQALQPVLLLGTTGPSAQAGGGSGRRKASPGARPRPRQQRPPTARGAGWRLPLPAGRVPLLPSHGQQPLPSRTQRRWRQGRLVNPLPSLPLLPRPPSGRAPGRRAAGARSAAAGER